MNAVARRPSFRRIPAGLRTNLACGGPGELDISAMATVDVSSEHAFYWIERAFDGVRGPGGSCWMAADPGEQRVTVAFDSPQALHTASIESEECSRSRTQWVELAVSYDGEATYEEPRRREFRFSPYGETFQRETWSVDGRLVTHLRFRIAPTKRTDPSGLEARASLTSIVLT